MTAIYRHLRYWLRRVEDAGDGAAEGTRYVVTSAHYLPNGRSPLQIPVMVVRLALNGLEGTRQPAATGTADCGGKVGSWGAFDD